MKAFRLLFICMLLSSLISSLISCLLIEKKIEKTYELKYSNGDVERVVIVTYEHDTPYLSDGDFMVGPSVIRSGVRHFTRIKFLNNKK